MKYNRIQEIENYIKNAKVASLDELLNQFDVSIQTLRRDLKELENRNVIKKSIWWSCLQRGYCRKH